MNGFVVCSAATQSTQKLLHADDSHRTQTVSSSSLGETFVEQMACLSRALAASLPALSSLPTLLQAFAEQRGLICGDLEQFGGEVGQQRALLVAQGQLLHNLVGKLDCGGALPQSRLRSEAPACAAAQMRPLHGASELGHALQRAKLRAEGSFGRHDNQKKKYRNQQKKYRNQKKSTAINKKK